MCRYTLELLHALGATFVEGAFQNPEDILPTYSDSSNFDDSVCDLHDEGGYSIGKINDKGVFPEWVREAHTHNLVENGARTRMYQGDYTDFEGNYGFDPVRPWSYGVSHLFLVIY